MHNQSHVTYLKKYGWTIKQFSSEMKYDAGSLSSYEERMRQVKNEAQLDLSPYRNKAVTETAYVLHENINGYNHVKVYIFESDHTIIGAYLALNHERLDNDKYKIIEGEILPMNAFRGGN
ncbi:DUF4830 domain-containing protein [Paenibacillus chungangensis]|uniref:DUF4830 domain-containing protein n=1 Tax=Paenibacillus chungangensis TaxID=696535 RepID=A0ABW3HNE9_9BACL